MDINEYLNNQIQIFLALVEGTFKPSAYFKGETVKY
jgi:hypothetical protein